MVTHMSDAELNQVLQEDLNQCKHYWVIESPTGPTSVGICKLCSRQKEFKNNPSVNYVDYSITLKDIAGISTYPISISQMSGDHADDN